MQAQDIPLGVIEPGRLFRAQHADMLHRLEARQVIIRKDHAPENMAALKRFALSLLKQENSLKRGVQGKRLKAAMNPDYLLKVLSV